MTGATIVVPDHPWRRPPADRRPGSRALPRAGRRAADSRSSGDVLTTSPLVVSGRS